MGFADHAFGDAAEEDGCECSVAVGADDDEIDGVFFDVFEHAVERAAFDDDAVGIGGIVLDGGDDLVEPALGAAAGFFLEGVHGGEFVGGEAVCGVAGFGLDDVDDGDLCAKGFGHSTCGFEDAGCGIGKINCGKDVFHDGWVYQI